MRRLYEAAITTGGDLRAMADRMGQSGHSLRLLLSRLRSIGAAPRGDIVRSPPLRPTL
jgi:hypothetical protein